MIRGMFSSSFPLHAYYIYACGKVENWKNDHFQGVFPRGNLMFLTFFEHYVVFPTEMHTKKRKLHGNAILSLLC